METTPRNGIADAPLLTPVFGLLVAAHFLQGLGQSSLILLPLYLDWLGGSRGQIGLVMALASLGGFLTRPFVGWALDRFGRRQVLTVGLLTFTAGMLCIAFVDDLGPAVWIARLLIGAGVGVVFTGYITLATDVIPEARRTEGIALFGVSGLLPMAFPPLITASGITAPDLRFFYPSISVLILGSLAFLWRIPEPPRHPAPPTPMAEVLVALRTDSLRPVWVAALTFGAMAYVFGAFATVVAEHRHVADPALLWLMYAIGAVAVRVFGARLPDRVGPARVLGPAMLSYVGAMAVAAVASDVNGFLLAGLLAGIGHGYSFPILAGQVATRAPKALRGSAMAGFTALWDLAALTFVPLAGVLADATTDGVMLMTFALAAAAAVVGWRTLERAAPA